MEYSTEKLIEEMKNYFSDDIKRIDHALKVLDYAREIREIEGGDSIIVESTAVLHDIGIHESEKKYNSAAGHYQEIEVPPIVDSMEPTVRTRLEAMVETVRNGRSS